MAKSQKADNSKADDKGAVDKIAPVEAKIGPAPKKVVTNHHNIKVEDY